MNGEGEYRTPEGQIIEGLFENDNFVKSLW